MNASGKQVWFSLCGWEDWYSPPDPALNYSGGGSLGNSWRIAGDGSGWGPLTNCLNTQAGAAPFAGAGAWPDPDLLIGPQVYVGGQSDEQARAQFSMWALFPTNLLISQNALAWSPYALETYSNAEAIAVNQDAAMSPARRVVGGDLTFPCHGAAPGQLGAVVAAACDAADASQQWAFDAASGAIASRAPGGGVLAATGGADGAAVGVFAPRAGDAAQAWAWPGARGAATNAAFGGAKCLDVFNWAGPAVDTWACNGGSNQNFTLRADGTISEPHSAPPAPGAGGPRCLAFAPAPPAAACTNVWGRRLARGWALGMVNNGDAPARVACDAACFAAMNVTGGGALAVRDVWAHAVVATISPPYAFSAVVNGSGAAALFTLAPA
jgi:hypothetical protein